MIKKKEDMIISKITKMRDGNGDVIKNEILGNLDMAKHARMFSTFSLNKGCSIGYHTHIKETEYYYILSGNGVVSEKDGDKEVKAGDIVITGDQESHAIRNDNEEPLVLLAIIILD